MVDGSRTTHQLTAAAAAATGLPEGLPVALGYVDVLCTALGGGVYEPGRAIGCSIVGSTGMHMRFLPDAAEVRLGPEPSATPCRSRCRACAQMQSNMAATLNIDWIVELGRQAAELLGHAVDRRGAGGARRPRARGHAGGGPLPPLHPRGGRTWAFIDVRGAGPAQRPVDADRPPRRGPLRLRGLGLAARDCYAAMGHVPEEIRVAGGAARSKALRTILASVLGAPVRESSRQEAGAAEPR